MDPRPKRTTPFRQARVPLRALILALVVALCPVAALAASSGQGASQGNQTKVAKGIVVALSPSSRSLDQGQSITYTVSATSTGGFTGTVTFAASGLPAGAVAAWQPSSVVLTSGSTAQVTMTVQTAPTTVAGKTDFTVKGTSGSVQVSAPAQLHVLEVKRTFDVTGSVDGLLAPGTTRPVNLQISNSNNRSIAVTDLTVAISQVVRTPAAVAANLPCTTADYKITQYSGTYPLTVAPGTRSLSALGVPESKRPQIAMLDTSMLQDGCKGATLQLAYSGTGQAN
ncbi:hypothetical protein DM793_07525 [Paenarthrobacter nitroguajacolicus]|uniref:COG1470 family protein n=1 Tax=Paenarthrobacter nitroguajacolicus TaxID=211146 RepID=UPI0015B8B242|nr:hypothetical protein [Paenarthrobacter nitroguajacolicus]NWL11147.1 hypothetical protein [Paenarthrobacter nitroguajacolicus]